MKFIKAKISLTKAQGQKLFPKGIYVSISNPLPLIGEEVIVTSLQSGKNFAGRVSEVDEKRRTYDAVIDLGAEVNL